MGGASPGRAELATFRVLVIGVAVAVGVSAIAAFLVADGRGRVPVPTWFAALAASGFAVLVVVGAAAPWLGLRALRRGAAVGVALFLLALVLFAPVSGVLFGVPTEGALPWALTAIGGIAVAAVAAGGPRGGWAVIVGWSAMVAWYRVALGGYTLTEIANDTQALTAAAVLCVIAGHALQTSRRLDAASASAEEAMAEQGSARGRLAARARVASFVHDEVLAALRGAADGFDGASDAVAAQARRASAVIDADQADHGGQNLVLSLRTLAAAADADLQIQRSTRAATPPRTVADALLVAARQALDNSVRHAGSCVRRVRLELGDEGLSLWIIDNGVGYSTAAVPPGRLGISTSIVGSMRDLAGGHARVISRPGAGTSVELRWDRPDASTAAADAAAADAAAVVASPPLPRMGVGIAVALFAATQTVVAAGAALSGAAGRGMPVIVLAGILSAAALLLPSRRQRVARGVSAVLVLSASVVLGVLTTPAPLTYGSAWFLPAAGFVLVAVALVTRADLALAGLLGVLVVAVVDAGVRGGDPVELVAVLVRTATIVGLGILLSISIARMRHSTRALARDALRAREQRAWDAAARVVIDEHSRELDELAGPLLRRLAAGERLAAADRDHARALEGRLRDGFRAGRLLQETLVAAAMDARLRGVDVVLLDDFGGGEAGEDDLEPADAAAVAAWMRALLDVAEQRFVGRLLPRGRSAHAHVVVDGRVESFTLPEPPVSVVRSRNSR